MSENLDYIYEVQNADTDSWFPCSIDEVTYGGDICVSYPEKWMATHWINGQYVRRRPFETTCLDRIQPGDVVEVQTNSSEDEPFSWWKATVKKVRGNHAVVRYDAWEEDFDDIFETSMIRPQNENGTFKDHCMNGRCTVAIPTKIQGSVLINDFAVLNEPKQEVVAFFNKDHSELALIGSADNIARAVVLAKFILQHLIKFQELYSVMQESVVSLIELVSQPNADSNPTIQLLQRAISAEKIDFKNLGAESKAVEAGFAAAAPIQPPTPPILESPESEPPVKTVTAEGKVDLDATLNELHRKTKDATYQYVNDVLLPGEVGVCDEFVIDKKYIGFAIGRGGKNFRHASRIKGIVQTEFSDVSGIIRIVAKSERALLKAKKLLTRIPPPRKTGDDKDTSDGSMEASAEVTASSASTTSTTAAAAASSKDNSPTSLGGSPKPKLVISQEMSSGAPSMRSSKQPLEIVSTTMVVDNKRAGSPRLGGRPSIEIPARFDSATPPRQESDHRDIVPIARGQTQEHTEDSSNAKFIARVELRNMGLPPRPKSGASSAKPMRAPLSGRSRRSPLPSPVFRKTPRSGSSTPAFRSSPVTPSFLTNRRISPRTPSSLPSPLSPSFNYPAFASDDEKWEFLVYTFKRSSQGKDWADINEKDEARYM